MCASIFVELDRVGFELEEMDVSPIFQLWDPENPDEPFKVPCLADVETCGVDQKTTCFQLGLSTNAVYFLANDQIGYKKKR